MLLLVWSKSEIKFSSIFIFFFSLNGYCHFIPPEHSLSAQAILIKKTDRSNSYTIKNIRIAYEYLQSKRFKEARKIIASFPKDSIFEDYLSWMRAIINQNEARILLFEKPKKQNFISSGIQLAKNALNEMLLVSVKNPYSPFVKDAWKEIVKTEFILAKAYYFLKNFKLMKNHYEAGFQRLQSQKSLFLIEPQNLRNYSEYCLQLAKNNSNHSCLSWIQLFFKTYAKKSNETLVLNQFFPDFDKKYLVNKSFVGHIIQSYKSKDQDQLAFEEVLQIYFDKKYSQAIKNFKLFLEKYPKSNFRFRAKFLLAQSFLKEKKMADYTAYLNEIWKESPLGSYGTLAKIFTQKSDESFSDVFDETTCEKNILTTFKVNNLLGYQTWFDPESDIQFNHLLPIENFHLKRAHKLLKVDAFELASLELQALGIKDSFSHDLLKKIVAIHFKAKNYLAELQIMTELILRGDRTIYCSGVIPFVFPTPFFDLIQTIAIQNTIDPILVLSLLKQESAFNENAISQSGAMGLMQLMPQTAYDVDSSVFLTDLRNPDRNVSIGVKYLKSLLRQFRGNIVFAIAGYNAGPYKVMQWIKTIFNKNEPRSLVDLVELIPYKETREYVFSIIRNYLWYSHFVFKIEGNGLDYFEKNSVQMPQEIDLKQ